METQTATKNSTSKKIKLDFKDSKYATGRGNVLIIRFSCA